MAYLVDANVLLRSSQPAHPMYADAVRAVETLLEKEEDVCIVPQTIYEFWSVPTRPEEARGGLGLSTVQAQQEVEKIRSALTLLPDNAALYDTWLQLVIEHGVLGVQVHDARLAAAMRVHDVTHILTFNTTDFKRYANITAVNPQDMVVGKDK